MTSRPGSALRCSGPSLGSNSAVVVQVFTDTLLAQPRCYSHLGCYFRSNVYCNPLQNWEPWINGWRGVWGPGCLIYLSGDLIPLSSSREGRGLALPCYHLEPTYSHVNWGGRSAHRCRTGWRTSFSTLCLVTCHFVSAACPAGEEEPEEGPA